MRYCVKCGLVIDEFCFWRDKQNCIICSGTWTEDDMTALKYAQLSEREKDEYDEHLLNVIHSNPKFDEYMSNLNHTSTKDGAFWANFRTEKMLKLCKYTQAQKDKLFKERQEELKKPFKPFPVIDTVKAQEIADDADFQHKAYERGYYKDKTVKESSSSDNKPKCPICSSTNLSKISNIKKATKIGLFGIFGTGDVGKTYKCNNCGSRF